MQPIPLRPSLFPAAHRGADRAREHPPVARGRILLAEDDPVLLQLLAEDLRAWGYDVIEAMNGFELLGALLRYGIRPDEDGAIDVVVTDVRMPGPWGTAAAGRFRQQDWTTPLVVMSAFADEHVQDECDRLGARLLRKPFAHERLRELLADLVP